MAMNIPQKSSSVSIPSRAGRYGGDEFDDDDFRRPDPRRGAPEVTVSKYTEDYKEVVNDDKSASLLWALLCSYLPSDEQSIQRLFVHRAEFDLAMTYKQIQESPAEQFYATALSVRDRLIERWKDTEIFFDKGATKRVYYLSLEFLMGRSLTNALSNLHLDESFARALRDLGIKMEELSEAETDAGLGNGGLGRLAACYLDSMATMNLPAWGYGLRYQYGMFFQGLKNGYQFEKPDFWLRNGNPWEIERLDVQVPVNFYGKIRVYKDARDGRERYEWEGGETVMAVAYDVPIPGYDTYNTINLRLWSSKPNNEFDLQHFNSGDYFKAIENKQRSETITSVLYPNDNTSEGKELRLKQQYFFVAATLADILKRYRKTGKPMTELADLVSIQLNDTHPTLGIVELMRILIDHEGLLWDAAWRVVRAVFAYTNHTVLPEALEKWDVGLVAYLLPRHMQIIFEINHLFLLQVGEAFPDNQIEMKRRMSLIQEEPSRKVRMAHLAIIGSHKVNGVAAIHSELLKTHVFPEFYQLYPDMFTNVTNGVTPRRWLHQAHPHLSRLITDTLHSPEWLRDLSLLAGLRRHLDDTSFHKKWRKAKLAAKERVAAYLAKSMGVHVPANALFDIQIKRLHEYKRQLLNVLSVIWRYRELKGMSDDERADVVPRVVIFGGKAAPGYYIAKLVIKLINCVAEKVNNDPDMHDFLRVVFVPNYNVSLAEMLIPASDLSQHISTAGMEASGTSNMKFAINGGLILGTMDGANIEIRDEIGHENMFIFGALAHDVDALRSAVRAGTLALDARLAEVIQLLKDGTFGEFLELDQLLESFLGSNDYYLITADWASYLDAQARVDKAWQDEDRWTRMSIASTAGCGKFSSDRSIRTYAEEIWGIKPAKRPGPVAVNTEQLAAALQGSQLADSSVSRHLSTSVGSFGGGAGLGLSPVVMAAQTREISVERLSNREAEFIQSTSAGTRTTKKPTQSGAHHVFFQ